MLNSRNKARIRIALKLLFYFVIAGLALAISTGGGAGRPRPLLLLSVAVAISVFEETMLAGIISAICGFLLDIGSAKLLGTNAALLLIIGISVSLLFTHLLRKNLVNVIAAAAAATFIHGMFDFFFYYSIWNKEGYRIVLRKITLPSMIYTIISMPIAYFAIKLIYNKLKEPEVITIEEQNESRSRQ